MAESQDVADLEARLVTALEAIKLLEQENDRSLGIIQQGRDLLDERTRERDALKALAKNAENKHDLCLGALVFAEKQRDEARAEVARLREACRKVVDAKDDWDVSAAADACRQALAKEAGRG